MKKAFVVVAAIALAVLSSVAAFAGTYALEKTNVQFDLPDSWKQGDSNIGTSFTSPKGDMIIFFGEVDGKNGIEAALEAVGLGGVRKRRRQRDQRAGLRRIAPGRCDRRRRPQRPEPPRGNHLRPELGYVSPVSIPTGIGKKRGGAERRRPFFMGK